jgi:hypothetical protein
MQSQSQETQAQRDLNFTNQNNINMRRELFSIATKTSVCYGHGDFGNPLRICSEDEYFGGKKFPPVFIDRDAAQKYIDDMGYRGIGKEVVTLELHE